MSKPGAVKIAVMVGRSGIRKNRQANNQLLAAGLGCGVLILVLVAGLVGSFILAMSRDRQAARYPDSVSVSSHSNYSGLPFEYRWDDTFLTGDNFTAVYNWYSITFDLGAEARANDRCILLEGIDEQVVADRYINVSLCNTPKGQMIFISRSTVINGRAFISSGVKELSSLFPN